MATLLTGFVLEKQSIGYAYGPGVIRELRVLDRFFQSVQDQAALMSRKSGEAYIVYRTGESMSGHVGRASRWRQFALYCLRQGIDAYIPPSGHTPIYRQDFCPYIYSRQEIASLFRSIDDLAYQKRTPRRIPNYRLLFRLLYGTGIRIGEALKLTIGDIDMETDTIFVREGKNKRSRLLPLTSGLAAFLKSHIEDYPGAQDSPLLLSPRGNRAWDISTVGETFRKTLLPKAGLPARVNGIGPRIHDLRHTFAVHRLENWFKNGEDIESKLPYLSAYMGHVKVINTYYYLRLTAMFFPEISKRFNKLVADVIPTGGIS